MIGMKILIKICFCFSSSLWNQYASLPLEKLSVWGDHMWPVALMRESSLREQPLWLSQHLNILILSHLWSRWKPCRAPDSGLFVQILRVLGLSHCAYISTQTTRISREMLPPPPWLMLFLGVLNETHLNSCLFSRRIPSTSPVLCPWLLAIFTITLAQVCTNWFAIKCRGSFSLPCSAFWV